MQSVKQSKTPKLKDKQGGSNKKTQKNEYIMTPPASSTQFYKKAKVTGPSNELTEDPMSSNATGDDMIDSSKHGRGVFSQPIEEQTHFETFDELDSITPINQKQRQTMTALGHNLILKNNKKEYHHNQKQAVHDESILSDENTWQNRQAFLPGKIDINLFNHTPKQESLFSNLQLVARKKQKINNRLPNHIHIPEPNKPIFEALEQFKQQEDTLTLTHQNQTKRIEELYNINNDNYYSNVQDTHQANRQFIKNLKQQGFRGTLQDKQKLKEIYQGIPFNLDFNDNMYSGQNTEIYDGELRQYNSLDEHDQGYNNYNITPLNVKQQITPMNFLQQPESKSVMMNRPNTNIKNHFIVKKLKYPQRVHTREGRVSERRNELFQFSKNNKNHQDSFEIQIAQQQSARNYRNERCFSTSRQAQAISEGKYTASQDSQFNTKDYSKDYQSSLWQPSNHDSMQMGSIQMNANYGFGKPTKNPVLGQLMGQFYRPKNTPMVDHYKDKKLRNFIDFQGVSNKPTHSGNYPSIDGSNQVTWNGSQWMQTNNDSQYDYHATPLNTLKTMKHKKVVIKDINLERQKLLSSERDEERKYRRLQMLQELQQKMANKEARQRSVEMLDQKNKTYSPLRTQQTSESNEIEEIKEERKERNTIRNKLLSQGDISLKESEIVGRRFIKIEDKLDPKSSFEPSPNDSKEEIQRTRRYGSQLTASRPPKRDEIMNVKIYDKNEEVKVSTIQTNTDSMNTTSLSRKEKEELKLALKKKQKEQNQKYQKLLKNKIKVDENYIGVEEEKINIIHMQFGKFVEAKKAKKEKEINEKKAKAAQKKRLLEEEMQNDKKYDFGTQEKSQIKQSLSPEKISPVNKQQQTWIQEQKKKLSEKIQKDYIIKALNNPGKADEILLTKKQLKPLKVIKNNKHKVVSPQRTQSSKMQNYSESPIPRFSVSKFNSSKFYNQNLKSGNTKNSQESSPRVRFENQSNKNSLISSDLKNYFENQDIQNIVTPANSKPLKKQLKINIESIRKNQKRIGDATSPQQIINLPNRMIRSPLKINRSNSTSRAGSRSSPNRKSESPMNYQATVDDHSKSPGYESHRSFKNSKEQTQSPIEKTQSPIESKRVKFNSPEPDQQKSLRKSVYSSQDSPLPGKNDKRKFRISRKTMKEFKLKEEDLVIKGGQSKFQEEIDHVNLNKQKLKNYNLLQEIKYYHTIVKNTKNQEFARQSKELADFQKRNETQEFINKWDNFRAQRTNVVENYFQVKKRQAQVIIFLKLCYQRRAYQNSINNYYYTREKRIIKYAGMRLSMIFGIKMRRTMRKYRGIQLKFKHHIRNAFTIHGLLHKPECENKIREIFRFFFEKRLQIKKLREAGIKFGKGLQLTQRKFRDTLSTKDAKIEVLQDYWLRLVDDLKHQINQDGKVDKSMLGFLFELNKVRPEVQYAAFDEYIKRCKYKHCIAFYQWRYMFFSSRKEQIIENLSKLSQYFIDHIDITKCPSSKTQHIAAISFQNEQKYGFQYEDFNDIKKEFLINSFWSIGLADPFPDEATLIEKDKQMLGNNMVQPDQLVYPQYKYQEEFVPLCLFIPSKPLMLKLMRACMGCESINELWFNR